MKAKKKNRVIVLVAVLLGLFVVAVGTPSQAAAKQITVGSILPLSGPISVVGMAWTRGYEMFFNKTNKEGGVNIGGEKYTFNLISEDSRSTAEASVTAARKLVHEDKAKFVFGTIVEACTDAIYEICERNRVMQLMPAISVPGNPSDVGPNKPFLVRPNINFDDGNTINLDFLKETYPHVKTLAISHTDSIWMDKAASFVRDAAGDRGIKVVHVEPWDFRTQDFLPVFVKILASKPDAIYCIVAGQTPQQLVAARQLGFKGPFISCSPVGPEVHIMVAGPKLCTDFICNGIDPENPTDAMREVMEIWKAKYREPFVGDAVLAWDEAWILVQAMQKAQTVDPPKVMSTLESMTEMGDLMTTFGPAKMGGKERLGVNRVLKRRIPLTYVMNGKIKLIGYQMGSYK